MTPAIGWVLVGLFIVGILAYDAYLVSRKRKSMSRVVWEALPKRPVIAYLAGFVSGMLGGHLFWVGETCLEVLAK